MAGISPYSLLNENGFQLVLRLAGNGVMISLKGSILNFKLTNTEGGLMLINQEI